VKLVPIDAHADVEALAASLAPGFGGDEAPARDILTQALALLTRDPRPAPWGAYLAEESERAVGTCAFKAAPDADGVVEIAYMTFPAYERRGFAAAMIAALSRTAFDAGVELVIAHTLPLENASNRALRRNGFEYAGEVTDPEDGQVWRWEKRG
jgi:RimJ/RimL family protein N-acetyltransferase